MLARADPLRLVCFPALEPEYIRPVTIQEHGEFSHARVQAALSGSHRSELYTCEQKYVSPIPNRRLAPAPAILCAFGASCLIDTMSLVLGAAEPGNAANWPASVNCSSSAALAGESQPLLISSHVSREIAPRPQNSLRRGPGVEPGKWPGTTPGSAWALHVPCAFARNSIEDFRPAGPSCDAPARPHPE